MTVKSRFLVCGELRILVSAGEPSGFLFAALLQQALARFEPGATVVRVRPGLDAEPAVGFVEGLRAAPSERRRLRAVVRLLGRGAPDCVVLIGYSGFNLPLAVRCRGLGIPVLYLAPPQVWVWGKRRVKELARAADRVVCLFPFEETVLREAGVRAVFPGYPLLDMIEQAGARSDTLRRLGLAAHERYVVFLSGSRPQETRFHRPLFRRVFHRVRRGEPGLRGVMLSAPGPDPLVGLAQRYGTIRHSECAVVVSGTATLETALLGTPQLVTYHLSPVSRAIARLVVRSRSFALPNILLGKGRVPEFLGPGERRLAAEVSAVLLDPAARQRAEAAAGSLRQMLGPTGAMERIARLVLEAGARGHGRPCP